MRRGLALVVVALLGCDRDEAAPPAATSAAGKVDWVVVPITTEPLPHVVKRELERARGDGRDLVIYVGASWCEPCQHFHEAVKRGELDATFPTLRLLELDLDRDGERLAQAGCRSAMIPLFAKPTDDGTCDPSRRVFGSVKGPGAVDNLVPRLQTMLGTGPAAGAR